MLAKGMYYRIYNHPAELSAYSFCELAGKGFSDYVSGGSVKVARMYYEALH
jgi:hypothetical protein